MIEFTTDDLARLWAKVDQYGQFQPAMNTYCWFWTGAWGGSGKPIFYSGKHNGGRLLHAGKLIYELVSGIPVGKTSKFIHICLNKRCVNPLHMLPDTLKTRLEMNTNKNGPIQRHMNTPCWQWTGFVAPDGYGKLSYRNKNIPAHRAAMILTHGKIPSGKQVCHHCDNKMCVRPDHLYFGTGKENARDAFERGLRKPIRGESVHNSKLTADNVREIRRLAAISIRQSELAQRYGVDQGHVSDIVNRKKWKHID